MTTTTTNYGWTKPDVGASTDAWGGILNSDLDGIDAIIHGIDIGAVKSINFGSTGLTPATVSTGAVVVSGTLAVANGGTGVTSKTGTGSVVLSDSPTFTTTATFAAVTCGNVNSSGTGTFAALSCSGNLTMTSTGRILPAAGLGCRAGTGGTQRTNNFNIDFTTGAQLWIDATNTGTITVSSDYRIKKDVVALPSMWGRAKALRPVSYTHQDFTPPVELARDAEAPPMVVADNIERWGFIAHELQETLISDAATGEKDSPTHIQSPNLMVVVATLTRALQEAMTRIEALEAKVA